MRSRRIIVAIVAAAMVVGVVLLLARGKSGRAGAAPPPVVAMPLPPPSVVPGTPRGDEPEHKTGTVGPTGQDPAAASQTPEQVFLARMAETKKALLAKHRYPDGSQPLATKTDKLLPHHVEPTIRMLGGLPDPSSPGGGGAPKPGKVKIEQNQDRLYLMPGQQAVASFQAMVLDGGPASISISRSDLTREATESTAATVVGQVTFRDDGNPPDEVASDGTWTGVVLPPNDGVACGMTLFVDVAADDGEKGTLAFPFVVTATPPASFTQTARDALEDGSVAFYVGIQVERAGLYEIIARVYDSTGAPVALLRFLNQLDTSATEVRLAAYGTLLVDEGAVPPLVLRDVEGHRMVLGQYPDREMMQDWPGGYVSAKYDLRDLTTQPYQDPQKQAQLQALEQATQNGVANIRSEGAATSTPNPTTPTAPPPR